jgi:4-amino-4-deoxy-L-arabinose transferase-like glycosyltransferase
MRATPIRFLLLLAAAAFLIRFAVVLLMRDVTAGPTGPDSADDVQFHRLGLRLADGSGYVGDQGQATAFRAPGLPFLLAAMYVVAGDYPPLVYVVNCLLGAAACVLTYFVARELLDDKPARWAGVLACVYLGHIYFVTCYMSENLFVPCLALGVWLFIRYLKGAPAGWLVVAGLVLGFATLTRPLALLLLPLLLPIQLSADRRQGRPWFAAGVAFSVSFLIVILPWTYRNYLVFDRLVLIATNGGSTFYGANNELVVTEPRLFGYWVSTTDLPHRDLIEAQPDEVSHDKMEWKLGIDWLRANPGKGLLALGFKFARLGWLPDFDPGRLYYLLRIIGHAPFFVLFFLGAIRLVRDRCYWTAPWLAVHATMLATILTALIFWGCPRFRDANLPFLMIYAVLGLQTLFPRSALASPAPTVDNVG